MPKRLKAVMEESLSDRLPIDVLPVSNEEFIPPEPTAEQHAIMKIAREDCEATARKLAMSRRKFLQTGAAYAICLAAINKVMGTRGGHYAWAQDSCGLNAPIGTRGTPTYFDLAHPGAQLNNLDGEFIMDLQTHHVVPSAEWYTENTGEAAFFLVAWSQANCGELDRNECLRFIQHVKDLSDTYGMPPLICAHKGFALPSFDQEKAATRDVGVVAPMFWDLASNSGVTFIIYHSGYDGDTQYGLGGPLNQGTSANGPYPGETAAPSTSRGVDNFITALRENGWSARHFAPGGSPGTPLAAGGAPADAAHANVPNVYAELGSVWGSVVGNPTRASWLLSKLIYWVGPKRVVWGTDALWGGSPQGLIEALRAFQMSDEARATYNLPWGIDGDVDDPTQLAIDPRRSIRNGILGRNAAEPYRIDPDLTLAAIKCDDVQTIRDQYMLSPIARNEVRGPRTRRELFAALRKDPWHRGAMLAQNEKGFLKRIS